MKFRLFETYRPMIIWSAFMMVVAGLALRVLHVLLTALLLKVFSFSFSWQLLRIAYPYAAGSAVWSDGKVITVYVLGTLFFLGLALLLIRQLLRLRVFNMKLRLFLTWFSFLSAHLFFVGLVAGIFINDELGMAFSWFFPSLSVRAAIVLVLFGISLLFRPLWVSLFLKISGSRTAIETYGKKRNYFRPVFLWPFVAGTLLSLPYALAVGSLFWVAGILALSLVALSLSVVSMPEKTPRLLKSAFEFSLSRKNAMLMAAVLAGILVLVLFF